MVKIKRIMAILASLGLVCWLPLFRATALQQHLFHPIDKDKFEDPLDALGISIMSFCSAWQEHVLRPAGGQRAPSLPTRPMGNTGRGG